MAKPRKNQETSLSRAIASALTAKGAVVWRIQSGTLPVLGRGKTDYVHCAPKGSPDLLVIIPMLSRVWLTAAEYVHIEVKTKTGKLSKEQAKFQEWARLNGVRSVVARSISDAINGVFGARS